MVSLIHLFLLALALVLLLLEALHVANPRVQFGWLGLFFFVLTAAMNLLPR